MRLADASLALADAPAVYVVTEGAGRLEYGQNAREIAKGAYFFLPYAVKGAVTVTAKTGIELIECFPPQG